MTWNDFYNILKKNRKYRIVLGILLIFVGSLILYKGIIIEINNPTYIWCYQCQIRRGEYHGSNTVPPIWLCDQCEDIPKKKLFEKRPKFRDWYKQEDLKDGAVSGNSPVGAMIAVASPMIIIGIVLIFIKRF